MLDNRPQICYNVITKEREVHTMMMINRMYEEVEIEEVVEFRANGNEEEGIPFDEYEEKRAINELYRAVYEFGYFD